MADRVPIPNARFMGALQEMAREWTRNGRQFVQRGLGLGLVGGAVAQIVHALEVTSATPDSDGYPARIHNYDGTTWEAEYEECRAVKIGGGTLGLGFYPPGVLKRVTTDGMHVYGVHRGTDPGDVPSTDVTLLACVAPMLGRLTQESDKTVYLDGSPIGTGGVDVLIGIMKQSQTISVVSTSGPDDCVEAVEDECCPPPDCTTEFVTGLNNTGASNDPGEQDPNWNNAWVMNGIPYPIGNDATSKWITNATLDGGSVEPGCVDGVGAGTFDYTTTFSCSDAANAVLCGRFLADDQASIRLNGVEVVAEGGGFEAWTEFNISSGFNAGANTLVFRVHDVHCAYQALRVEFYT